MVASASVATLLAATPSQATIRGPQSTDVSCDAVTVKAGVTVTQRVQGSFAISYNSSVNANSRDTWFTARSSQGNDLSRIARVPGQTASWSSVRASNYTVRLVKRSQENCNELLPGSGNFGVNYTVTYQG